MASGLEASSLTASGGKLIDQIRDLTPKNEGQRWAQSQALQLTTELARSRWLMIEQNESAIPTPFLVVVVFWLTILFTSFGLFSPWNSTVVATLLVCAVGRGSRVPDRGFGPALWRTDPDFEHAASQRAFTDWSITTVTP